MIEIGINGLYKNFGYKNVLSGTSFEVMTGDRMALVGRNGSGKTTILKIVAGLDTPDKGGVSIRKGATVGYLEQIPELQPEETTVFTVLMASFQHLHEMEERMRDLESAMSVETDEQNLHGLMRRYANLQSRFAAEGGYDIEEDFARAVAGFSLSDLLNRPFNVISGGQKTIVKLAATVLKKPDILLLDEPTNHLDVNALAWFEEMLSKFKGTALIVSHDRYFLDMVATRTVFLEKGECEVYDGNYSKSLAAREAQLLIEFETYKNQQKKIEAMKAAIKRFHEWGVQGDNEKFFRKEKELKKRLEKIEVLERPVMEKKHIAMQFGGKRTGKEVLRTEHLHIAFGENVLFDDAEMLLLEKEKLCLMGDNGTGKTTLIRAFLTEDIRYSGRITISPSALVGYIPQEIRFESAEDTVVGAFRRECIMTEGEARNLLAKYFFFGDQVFKRVSMLSGGEKVLLKLAMLLQTKINFLILDEPTNHIDIETREILEEALTDYEGTLLFISHDRYFIKKIATRAIEITGRRFAAKKI